MDKSKKSKQEIPVETKAVAEEIQLDLEAFTPTDSDIFGITLLLQQLLRNVKADERSLADLIVKYNCGASIMKQVDDAEEGYEEPGATTSTSAEVDMERGDAGDNTEDATAILSVFTSLPRSERTVAELVQALVNRLPKDAAVYGTFATAAQDPNLLLVMIESIVNFPAKIAVAMCSQFIDADLQACATQYVSYRSISNVMFVRRAVINSHTDGDTEPGATQIDYCFEEDRVFAEFASAVCGFKYALTSKSKQKQDSNEKSSAARKRNGRDEEESDSEEESDIEPENAANGIALMLFSFDKFVAAAQKLKATYL